MKKALFSCYSILCLTYILLTIIEFLKYINFESNYFGLIYLLLSFLILFLLIILTMNCKKANYKIRISKVLVIVILGIYSSYFLFDAVTSSLSYVDSSKLFLNKTIVSIKVFKPICYYLMIGLVILEILYKNHIIDKLLEFKNRSKYRINKHY